MLTKETKNFRTEAHWNYCTGNELCYKTLKKCKSGSRISEISQNFLRLIKELIKIEIWENWLHVGFREQCKTSPKGF